MMQYHRSILLENEYTERLNAEVEKQTRVARERADRLELMSEEARVTVGSGTVSGENGKGFIRLNVGTPRSVLEQGLASICRTFAPYERKKKQD